MGIQIDASQAEKIKGNPVDQCYVTSVWLDRTFKANAPWVVKIKFCMAIKADDGSYIPTRRDRIVTVADADAYAIAELTAGRTDFAMGMPPFQKALAHAISQQCIDISSAHYVEA